VLFTFFSTSIICYQRSPGAQQATLSFLAADDAVVSVSIALYSSQPIKMLVVTPWNQQHDVSNSSYEAVSNLLSGNMPLLL
jgi:hypothetical protein